MEAIWLRIVGAVLFLTGMAVIATPIRIGIEVLKSAPSASGMEIAGYAMAQSLYFEAQAPRIYLAVAAIVLGGALYGFGAVVAAIDRLTPPS